MTGEQAGEVAETTNRSQPVDGLTADRVIDPSARYPGSSRYPFESTVRSLGDLYQSVVNPASRPELNNPQVFSRVGDLLLTPKLSFEALGTGFNQILKDQGFPPVQLQKKKEFDDSPAGCGDACKPSETNEGSYVMGHGRINIPERLFDSNNARGLGNSLLHEANHFTQDILMTRAIMDDVLKANPKADPKSAEFIASVGSKYHERFNIKPSDEFLRSVEQVRAGKELTPQERIRADKLTEGYIEQAENALRPSAKLDRQNLRNWAFRIESGEVKPEDFVNNLMKVVNPASDNMPNAKEWRRMLFANDKVTTQDIERGFGNPASPNFDRDRAKSAILQLLKGRARDITSSVRDEYFAYQDYSHEVESREVEASFQSYFKSRRK